MFKIPLPRLVGLSLLLSLSACVTKSPKWTWPVKEPLNLSRKFSVYHEGIDFPKRTGHPVFSVAEGKVIYAGSKFTSYGNTIIIEHPNKWASLYAHLSKMQVQAGYIVAKGQKIGEVGNTGRSSGPHLHFELMYEKQPLNPVPVLSR